MPVSPARSADEIAVHPRLYVERVVFSPPVAAEAAFDLLLDLRAEPAGDSVRYRFPTPAGDLVLRGPVRLPAHRPASAVFPVRLVEGMIVSRTGVYKMHVELELLRWSGRAAVLGLRPLDRHPLLGFGPYLRIGCDAMTSLRKELETWAEAGTGKLSA